ncbi:MAG: hypothetical protein U0791_09485 [Gemmataceae bacterium]
MSFTEMLEGVKLLTLEEKQQLRDALDDEFDPRSLLPPGFEIRPGMVFDTGYRITTDEAGLKLFYELAGIPIPQ